MMGFINVEELLKKVNEMELTPDGGVDINELEEIIKESAVAFSKFELEAFKDFQRILCKKLDEAMMRGKSEEQRVRAKKRWDDLFDKVYYKNPSLFNYGREIVIADRESLETYDEEGRKLTLHPDPYDEKMRKFNYQHENK